MVAQSCEAAEGHVICPIEASVVFRVLHTLWPIGLALQILLDLTTLILVLLLGWHFIFHQGCVHQIHFLGLLSIPELHLFNELTHLLIIMRLIEHLWGHLDLTRGERLKGCVGQITSAVARVDLNGILHDLMSCTIELTDVLVRRAECFPDFTTSLSFGRIHVSHRG